MCLPTEKRFFSKKRDILSEKKASFSFQQIVMGLCQSTEEDNKEHQRSNEIDKLIEKEKNKKEKECKILLLGNRRI